MKADRPAADHVGGIAESGRKRTLSWVSGVPGFALVAEGEQVDDIPGGIVPVQGDVAAGPEADRQFAQVCFLIERAAHVRGGFQGQQAGCDHLPRALCRLGVFLGQEGATADQPLPGAFGDDQPWHGGQSPSDALPQLVSQAVSSLPVMCCPVS